ncbi:MAG: hypothetical protein ACKERG_04470 [Candidatus Hodgkinia cicadicola]
MSARLVHVEVRCKRWMCQPEAVLKLVGWAASSVWRVTKTPFEATLILRGAEPRGALADVSGVWCT